MTHAATRAIRPSGQQIEIAHADQQAVIVEVGGGLRTYAASGRELLDGYGVGEMSTSGRGQVLIPWPNRIQDGSYTFEGRRHQLPINDVAERNAIHGLVRWAPWTVAEREPHRVVMELLVHPRPGYPFSLMLAIDYQLSEGGLRVQTTATNRGPTACPFGSGAHPYLTVGTETVDSVILRAPGRTVLTSDERGIPVCTEAVDDTGYDFRRPRPIGATKLDNAFTDLERDDDGLARVLLRDPNGGRSLTLWLDETYPYLMLFTGDPLPDVARQSLAVEPMTCPPNAFRTGAAVIRLEPGRSFTTNWGHPALMSSTSRRDETPIAGARLSSNPAAEICRSRTPRCPRRLDSVQRASAPPCPIVAGCGGASTRAEPRSVRAALRRASRLGPRRLRAATRGCYVATARARTARRRKRCPPQTDPLFCSAPGRATARR